MRRHLAKAALAILATGLIGSAAKTGVATAQLKVVVVDVEGGAAMLYITPERHSLLVDTGWPAGLGGGRPLPGEPSPPATASSAERIVAAAHANGLTRIDYVMITHYHVDHVGGLTELLSRIPIGEVIDHGPNREFRSPGMAAPSRDYSPQAMYPKYEEAIRNHPHRVMRPGERLRLDNLVITAVDSDRELIRSALGGAGGRGVNCASLENKGELGGEENPRSLGFVASWGRARILSLADTTWDVEQQLVCPRNRIGPVDIMFADNHGSDNSNSRALLEAVRPRVVIIGNGRVKGAMPGTMRTLASWPGYKGVWQLHYATRNGPGENTSLDQIANAEGGPDVANSLELTIAPDATIAVRNPRTESSKTYARLVGTQIGSEPDH